MVLDISVDAMDISGETQLDVDHNIFKKRLSSTGEPVNAGPTKQNGKQKLKRHIFFLVN